MKLQRVPWRRKRNRESLARREDAAVHPFEELHREINRLFEDFFGDVETGLSPQGLAGLRSRAESGAVRVDVSENEKEVRVVADLPGMEEKDIDVEMSENLLTIKGERQEERDEKEADYRVVERSYGAFQRSIPLPDGLEQDKAKAEFKKGVLTITLPKSAEAASKRKQIPISAA